MNDRAKFVPATDAVGRRTIGGSTAPAVVGVSEWGTPYTAYLSLRGELPEQPENAGMKWGKRLERPVLEAYADERRVELTALQRVIRNPAMPFAHVTVDALTADGTAIVEAKTARSDHGWGEDGTDEIPLAYGVQCQHAMAVTGILRVDVPVLIAGSDFRIYTVRRDDELIEMLIERERDLWRRVLDADPPEPTNPEDLRLRWPSDSGREVEATDGIIQAWGELVAVKLDAKHAEDREKELSAQIQAYMADASALIAYGRQIATWKKSKDSAEIDAARLALEHPEIYAQYLKPKIGSRRFLLKKG